VRKKETNITFEEERKCHVLNQYSSYLLLYLHFFAGILYLLFSFVLTKQWYTTADILFGSRDVPLVHVLILFES
jgi:hypothetical protein